jgi:hypothetical protein
MTRAWDRQALCATSYGFEVPHAHIYVDLVLATARVFLQLPGSHPGILPYYT